MLNGRHGIWLTLNSEDGLDEILERSYSKVQAIFKHSTRCSISSMAKNRMDTGWIESEDVDLYYLDLLRFRPVSNKVEEILNVKHESPQIILIKNGEVIYHASHGVIDPEVVKSEIAA